MLRFLNNLLRGGPRTNARSTYPGESKTSNASQMPVEHRSCRRLTRRVEDTMDQVNQDEFVCSYLDHMIGTQLLTRVRSGAVEIHVLRVDQSFLLPYRHRELQFCL